MRLATLAGVGVVVAAAWAASRNAEVMVKVEEVAGEMVAAVKRVAGVYSPESVPVEYRAEIAQAERAHDIPAGLLARLLWQESRYRPDVISGKVASPAGALGIAQFMPATAAALYVDPLNPANAINGAALYLSRLYRQFGDWREALAAYNWGPGNVSKKGIAAAPAETRNYYTSIMSDVGLS